MLLDLRAGFSVKNLAYHKMSLACLQARQLCLLSKSVFIKFEIRPYARSAASIPDIPAAIFST